MGEMSRVVPLRISTTTSYPSPADCHHFISRSPLGPLCVLLVLDRARGPIRHSVGHLLSSVKVRVVGQRSCPCSACVRLHVLHSTRPYTCSPQDLQLDLSDRVALSSKGLVYKRNFVGRVRTHVRSHARSEVCAPSTARRECCSPLEQCVS